MSKPVLTEKGQRVRAHLDRCDKIVRQIFDPVACEAVNELIDAIEALAANDDPCWEQGQ